MSIYIQVAHILKDRIRAAVFYEMRINIQIIILPYAPCVPRLQACGLRLN